MSNKTLAVALNDQANEEIEEKHLSRPSRHNTFREKKKGNT